MTVLLVLLAPVSACTGEGEGDGTPSPSVSGPPRGGTLRVAMPRETPVVLDPATYAPCGVYGPVHRLLLRRLFSYPGLPAADGGVVARPDLATAMPTVSTDGLTWTIRLKQGLYYAPPYEDREIVAQDVVRALERLADPSVWDYPWGSLIGYFSVIEGFDEVAEGRADAISGLETPDEHTLVVRLLEPAGDLPQRLAMTATAPIPAGAAEGHPKDYFRFLAASGPYMIEGSEALDPSLPPPEQDPVAGYVPPKVRVVGGILHGSARNAPGSLTLVRNPSWVPESDQLRAAYPDRIEISMPLSDGSGASLSRRIASSRYDIAYTCSGMMTEQVAPFAEGKLAGTIHDEVVAAGEYVPLNLAVPPLDDVHVRRAVVLALDRAGYVHRLDEDFRGYGTGVPISHIVPGNLEGGLLSQDWRPSWMRTPDPDIEAARAEMRRSGYDVDGDGRCDRCPSVLFFDSPDYARPFATMLHTSLREVGIRLDVRLPPPTPALGAWMNEPSAQIGLITAMGWVADYPNASTFFVPLFHGPSITERGNYNRSLLGATHEQLDRWGYEVTEVPSADDRIERCMAATGHDQTECWTDLDRWLMEEIVPAIPLDETSATWVTSPRVVAYSFDAATGQPALDRIALREGSD